MIELLHKKQKVKIAKMLVDFQNFEQKSRTEEMGSP